MLLSFSLNIALASSLEPCTPDCLLPPSSNPMLIIIVTIIIMHHGMSRQKTMASPHLQMHRLRRSSVSRFFHNWALRAPLMFQHLPYAPWNQPQVLCGSHLCHLMTTLPWQAMVATPLIFTLSLHCKHLFPICKGALQSCQPHGGRMLASTCYFMALLNWHYVQNFCKPCSGKMRTKTRITFPAKDCHFLRCKSNGCCFVLLGWQEERLEMWKS